MERNRIVESVSEAFRNYSDINSIRVNEGLVKSFVDDIMRSFDLRVKAEVNRILKEEYGEEVKEKPESLGDYYSDLKRRMDIERVELENLKTKSRSKSTTVGYIPRTTIAYQEYIDKLKAEPIVSKDKPEEITSSGSSGDFNWETQSWQVNVPGNTNKVPDILDDNYDFYQSPNKKEESVNPDASGVTYQYNQIEDDLARSMYEYLKSPKY